MLVRTTAGPWLTTQAATHGICRHRNALTQLHVAAAAAAPGSSGGAAPEGGSTDSSELRAADLRHTIQYRGRKVQAQHGSTLRTAMLEAGVTPHNGRATLINCRGLGTCGTCAVEVQGPVEPAEWTTQERMRLNFPPHHAPGNQRLRLACQVACQGDLEVFKRDGFWGEGDRVLPDLPSGSSSGSGGEVGSPAEAAAAVQPLGQLEFILDRRRRQQ